MTAPGPEEARATLTVTHLDAGSAARRGQLATRRGVVQTPAFMPVGTLGTVKAMTPRDLVELGAEVILGNTYHLYLRPGVDVVQALGGLHKMAAWNGPILTDSGGFQVFSLRDSSRIDEEGVTFRSHLDGSHHRLTPEKSIAIQEILGSDIMMAFDDCPPAASSVQRMRAALQRTHAWAARCTHARTREGGALFGIVQGGVDPDARRASVQALTSLPFDGYALGGLSVGEHRDAMWSTVAVAAPWLPADKPRYLMGVGTPEDLMTCVGHGIDMFDCVMPTRHARTGRLMTLDGDLNIRNARFKSDGRPVDASCDCYTCQNFSRGYLRHLEKAREALFNTLATTHNLHLYLDLMRRARAAIEVGTFAAFAADVVARRSAG